MGYCRSAAWGIIALSVLVPRIRAAPGLCLDHAIKLSSARERERERERKEGDKESERERVALS